ncbi:Capsanthin/capsorubin synthase, chromoplastic [Linum grandiflorum]
MAATPLPLFSQLPATKPPQFPHFSAAAAQPPNFRRPTRIHSTTSSKFGSFLDLKPDSHPEPIHFPDLPFHHPNPTNPKSSQFDVIVIGAGPAGLRLAEQISLRGIKVCSVDPSPLSSWPNNYGSWLDEFEPLDLSDCIDKTWPTATVHIDDDKTKHLNRPYSRLNRTKLKTKLLTNCTSNGVVFKPAKVWDIRHTEFQSVVVSDDGEELKASLVIDASGFGSPFVQYDDVRGRKNEGYQIAHGVLAEVEGGHPFDLDQMVLMDWRDSHMGNEPYLRKANCEVPTFLYTMPFDSDLVFLEETSLVSRDPVLGYGEVKRRMDARLRHLGIRVKRVIEEEKCLIPMGGRLPAMPQRVVGFGGNSGLVHPATGYLVARTLALAPTLADVIAECLGSTRMIRGMSLYDRVWKGMWTSDMKSEREFYRFGMETLLKLDLNGTRRFFDAFFDLEPHYWQGFLSSKLSLTELMWLCLSLFGHASNPSRVDIVTKCPLPLVKMAGNMALEAL